VNGDMRQYTRSAVGQIGAIAYRSLGVPSQVISVEGQPCALSCEQVLARQISFA